MTGVRELTQLRVISAAPELVRLSVLGGRTQLDISLPLDAPVADAIPELVKLVQSRDSVTETNSPSPSKDAQRHFWVLRGPESDEPLPPDVSLREAGVTNGTLLRLTNERTLSIPTLYDDVVDAAARLNRAAYAGWDASAAKWMAFAGVNLAALTWLYFLISPAFKPHRVALVGISTVVALTLVGVATLAYRSYKLPVAGAALGWAAIPITAGIAWATLSGLGGYGLAAVSAALVIAMYVFGRVIGTGHWGYVYAGTFFALGAIALAVHQVGVRTDLVGCGLAVVAILSCLTVPRLTARFGRFNPPQAPVETDSDQTLFENPFESPSSRPAPAQGEDHPASTPTVEDVWERVRWATLLRSAIYAALATAAVAGAATSLLSPPPVRWPTLTFALVCAATLAIFTRRPDTTVERAALALPAVALGAFTCWTAQSGGQPIPLVAFGLLLATTIAMAVVAMTGNRGARSSRALTVLAYLDYLATLALIPLALWVAGVYGRLGV